MFALHGCAASWVVVYSMMQTLCLIHNADPRTRTPPPGRGARRLHLALLRPPLDARRRAPAHPLHARARGAAPRASFCVSAAPAFLLVALHAALAACSCCSHAQPRLQRLTCAPAPPRTPSGARCTARSSLTAATGACLRTVRRPRGGGGGAFRLLLCRLQRVRSVSWSTGVARFAHDRAQVLCPTNARAASLHTHPSHPPHSTQHAPPPQPSTWRTFTTSTATGAHRRRVPRAACVLRRAARLSVARVCRRVVGAAFGAACCDVLFVRQHAARSAAK